MHNEPRAKTHHARIGNFAARNILAKICRRSHNRTVRSAMATANLPNVSTFLPVEEYLNTTYRPDVDYVDGHIEERDVGDFDHADLQTQISVMMRNRQKEWGVRVAVEARIRVSPTRIRIPDVCVLDVTLVRERIITHPPLLCIEVLSPRDSLKSMRKRVQNFFDMGVLHIWIFDPETRTAHACTPTAIAAHTSGTLRVPNTPISLSLEEAFATLDA
jgi:Uma2 family endonuclease